MFEAGVNNFPHSSQMKYLLSIICTFWESHNIRQNEATNNDFHLKHKWQMQMLCNISEEFEGPHGHDTLEKCFLHVNYALKHFLVNTPWRCSWKLTLGIRPCFWRKCYQMQMLCKSIGSIGRVWRSTWSRHRLSYLAFAVGVFLFVIDENVHFAWVRKYK